MKLSSPRSVCPRTPFVTRHVHGFAANAIVGRRPAVTMGTSLPARRTRKPVFEEKVRCLHIRHDAESPFGFESFRAHAAAVLPKGTVFTGVEHSYDRRAVLELVVVFPSHIRMSVVRNAWVKAFGSWQDPSVLSHTRRWKKDQPLLSDAVRRLERLRRRHRGIGNTRYMEWAFSRREHGEAPDAASPAEDGSPYVFPCCSGVSPANFSDSAFWSRPLAEVLRSFPDPESLAVVTESTPLCGPAFSPDDSAVCWEDWIHDDFSLPGGRPVAVAG